MEINLKEILKESFDNQLLNESRRAGFNHLYDDYKMTFGELRSLLNQIFSGKTTMTEKCDGMNIGVSYKDGNLCFARNKSQLKEPLNIEKLGKHFDGEPLLKEAFVNSANDLEKALKSINKEDLERIFANGQNFANIQIVYPPCKNIMDYNNRCFLQLNGIDCYDKGFNKISDDEYSSKWLYDNLRAHKALKQEMFEITEPNILRMKDSVSANKALESLMTDFNNVIDGYSTKCTIQDYANEKLRKAIINVCNKNNIEVERDCQFVRELADRLGNFSFRRPTKADICTFAKRAGVNVHSDDYKNVITTLDENRDSINEEILRPIHNLASKAGLLLMKNLTGFMSGDPRKCSQRLVAEVEGAIHKIQEDESKLTVDKLKIFRKNIKKLDEYAEKYLPCSGVVCKIGPKCYHINGMFGPIAQIMNILKY